MKAKFNYLEKLPLRKFKTSKNTFACAIEEKNEAVLIVEIIDINDNLNTEEIAARTHVEDKDKTKYLIAYIIPKTSDNVEKLRADAVKYQIPQMDENDEITQIKQLYLDKRRKEVFIAIILAEQHSMTFVRI